MYSANAQPFLRINNTSCTDVNVIIYGNNNPTDCITVIDRGDNSSPINVPAGATINYNMNNPYTSPVTWANGSGLIAPLANIFRADVSTACISRPATGMGHITTYDQVSVNKPGCGSTFATFELSDAPTTLCPGSTCDWYHITDDGLTMTIHLPTVINVNFTTAGSDWIINVY